MFSWRIPHRKKPMSVLDKLVAAVTPPESTEARAEANAKAWAAAEPGDFLTTALEHHRLLLDAFAAARSALDEASRTAAQKHLGIVLVGHAGAEETVLYPALADAGEAGHADLAYGEQIAVKLQMAALEALPPMSQDWLDKLEHIEVRCAITCSRRKARGSWSSRKRERIPGGPRPASRKNTSATSAANRTPDASGWDVSHGDPAG